VGSWQHTPLAHAPAPTQATLHAVPESHVTCPTQLAGPPHAIVHWSAWHVTLLPQDCADPHCTSHDVDGGQTMSPAHELTPVHSTRHGMLSGHCTPFEHDAVPWQSTTHTPLESHVPIPACSQPIWQAVGPASGGVPVSPETLASETSSPVSAPPASSGLVASAPPPLPLPVPESGCPPDEAPPDPLPPPLPEPPELPAPPSAAPSPAPPFVSRSGAPPHPARTSITTALAASTRPSTARSIRRPR
jgi:hypothetical protein